MKTPFLSPKIIRADEGECLQLRGETRHQLLDARDTNGAFSLAHSRFEAGAGAPLHLHTSEDEWFCVLQGRFRFQTGQTSHLAAAGDFVFGPRGVPHAYTCDEPGSELLIGVTPGGFEQFFREIAAGQPQNPAQMREIAANYGVQIEDFDPLPTPETAPLFRRVGEGERLEAFGDGVRVGIASRETAGRFCVVENQTPSFCGPPPHLHEREDEAFFIRAGCYEFQLGDARLQAHPGDLVFAPRGVPHAFRVVSSEPGQSLVFAAPGGFDEFFAACAQLFHSGKATPELIGEIGAARGLRFLSPEP